MTCQDMTDLLVSYAGDELAPAQREFVDLHLKHCAECRQQFADLQWTRHKLEGLRAEHYHPALTETVMTRIQRQRVGRTLASWTRRTLRGAVAAAACLALVYLGMGWMRGDLTALHPAGEARPAPGTRAYAYVDDRLLQIDVGTGKVTASDQVPAGARIVSGGGSLFVQLGERALIASPSGGPMRQIDAAIDRRAIVVAATLDGRGLWLVRNLADNRFAVDRLDVFSGRIDPDPQANEGQILDGVISRDGFALFLAARFDSSAYIKQIRTGDRQREYAWLLQEWQGPFSVLLSPDGQRAYAVGDGWAAVAALDRLAKPVVTRDARISQAAVVAPDGESLIVAGAGGGLVQISRDGQIALLAASSGPRYTHLAWSEGNQWLYSVTEGRLDIRNARSLSRVAGRVALPAGPVRAVGVYR